MVRRPSYASTWSRWVHLGRWLHRGQRLSGLVLLVFAVWHIVEFTASAGDAARLAGLLSRLVSPGLVVLVLLTFSLHALNGMRLVLLDLGLGGDPWHRFAVGFTGAGALFFLLATGWWFLR
jgi:succinate dehydrogenase hydrophobic anchor subunit